MSTVSAPTYSDTVDQSFFIEPLGGPSNPSNYLDKFPEAVYDTSSNSHLVRLLYTLIGTSGVNSLKKSLLDVRLVFEAHGLQLFNLEGFYGDPFAFGRILDEVPAQDVSGILTREEWDTVRAQDEKYRSRALDYMNGVKAGNSPLGMRLVARSGLGHEVEIVENYRFLFDNHSDDPLGLSYVGTTNSTEEFIIVPRREVSETEVQIVSVDGFPDGGTFMLAYQGIYTTPISYLANHLDVEIALQAVGAIGAGNVQVTGGPIPNPFRVIFRGLLADKNVQELTAFSSLASLGDPDNPAPQVSVVTEHAGLESKDETTRIAASDQHSLQEALDRLRPVTTIPTVNAGTGTSERQPWKALTASSSYHEARTFVTGAPDVPWPAPEPKKPFWISPDVETQAPVPQNTPGYHYVHFHKASSIDAYSDAAISDPAYLADKGVLANYRSEHTGRFNQSQRDAFPFLRPFTDDVYTYGASGALHGAPQQVRQTGYYQGYSYYPYFNYYYSYDYLQYYGYYGYGYGYGNYGYRGETRAGFWSSVESETGSEFLEIDLGTPQAVNFITLDISRKPVDIEISLDHIDQSPARRFQPIYPMNNQLPTSVTATYEFNPWEPLEFYFQDRVGNIPMTRFIRIRLKRRTTGLEPLPGGDSFLYNSKTKVQNPWSVEIRNLRIGRNVQPAPANPWWGNYQYYYPWYGQYDYYGRSLYNYGGDYDYYYYQK